MATRAPKGKGRSLLKADVKTVYDRSPEEYRRITQMGRYSARVGLFEGAMPDGEKTGTSIAQYMFYQEFGTQTIPESPWFRTALEGNKGKTGRLVEREAKAILDGRTKAPMALTRLAVEIQNDMKISITDFGLIDTGAARNAVVFEIIDAGRAKGRP